MCAVIELSGQCFNAIPLPIPLEDSNLSIVELNSFLICLSFSYVPSVE
jgi:hypothetical protein